MSTPQQSSSAVGRVASYAAVCSHLPGPRVVQCSNTPMRSVGVKLQQLAAASEAEAAPPLCSAAVCI
jgi:hypothetical protein